MVLSPQQLELLLYLVGAILIGFIFGYFLSQSFKREKKKEIEVIELEHDIQDNYSKIVKPTK